MERSDNFSEAVGEEILQNAQEVRLTGGGLHIIFGENGILDLSNSQRLLDQAPNVRADRIESVVDTVAQVENRRVPGDITRDLVRNRNHF